ncbi:MAG: GntR family transcriptional regulator [Eubacterium sp.]
MNDFNPKYQEIVNSIKEKIQSNTYVDNHPLPSETTLCSEYNASRITVRKAISVLLSEGYIYSVQGKGNYIKKVKRNKFYLNYSYKSIFKNGYDEAKLISSNLIKPDVYLVYNLSIAPEEKVVALKWVVYENNRPIAYDEKYLAYFSGINISEKSLRYQDFSDLVKNRISPYEINQKIQIKGIKADETVAKHLKIQAGDVLALIEIKVLDQNGLPFGWGKLYVLPDKVTFMAHSINR